MEVFDGKGGARLKTLWEGEVDANLSLMDANGSLMNANGC